MDGTAASELNCHILGLNRAEYAPTQVRTWGILSFKDLSLKEALQNYVMETKLNSSAANFLQCALEFFNNQASTFRRSAECPHLAWILSSLLPSAQKTLVDVLSTLEISTRLIETSQSPRIPKYLDVMQTGPLDFCRILWTLYKAKYQDPTGNIGGSLRKSEFVGDPEQSSGHDEFNVIQSMIEIFQAFGDERSIDIQRFLFMLDYFDFEERYPFVSRKEVIEIFEGNSPMSSSKALLQDQVQTKQTLKGRSTIDYANFKSVMAQISAHLNVPVKDFVRDSLLRIELKRLFAEHSTSNPRSSPSSPVGNSTYRRQRSARSAGDRGSRPILIDFGGFYQVLQACNVSDRVPMPDAAAFFKNSTAREAHSLKFNDFYKCLENVAAYLSLDLLALVTPFRLISASERRVCLLNLQPQVISTHSLSDNKVFELCNVGVMLAKLFLALQQDTHALGMLCLVLSSSYGLESYSELSQASMNSVKVDVLELVISSLDLIADCSVRLVRFLLSQRAAYSTSLKTMKEERMELDTLIQERKRVRNRRRNAVGKEDSVSVYENNLRRLDQINAEILDKTQDIDEISREIHEIRRRAHTSVQAITHLLAQDKRLTATQRSTLAGCCEKLQVAILRPEHGQWRIPRLSFFAVTRILHALRRARARLQMQAQVLQL